MTDLPYRSPTFATLQKKIDREVVKFQKTLGFQLKPRELQMRTCWINIMSPLAQHSLYIHPLGVISGTYYLQADPHSGDFQIEDPRLPRMMACPPRRGGVHATLKPVPGNLVLFESWLHHAVLPGKSMKGQDRVSVSFNYEWVEV
jgi:uncharacterized protein (TIGR02466 family)